MAQSFNLTARINMAGPYNLRPIVSKIKKDIGAIKPELKFKLDPTAASSIKKVTAEIKKLDAATKGAQKSVGSLNSQLVSLASSFNAASVASKNAANASANVGKATAAAAKSATQARTAIEEFGKQSGLAIKRFAAFSSVTSIIFGVTNAITDAYKEFLIFNKEIVRLSQVTDKSVSDLKGISNEITRLSTSIGVASSDLITVASTLAQAGLSAQDTKIALEALAKSALAPSFENIIDTTEGAIAAIRQFGLETSQLEGALGSINAVAAAFAVEASDIIAAIQRTGGVFASASRGVSEGTDSLNEFIAIFTSIRQTTRESAETIATGLRTIFTRIQRSSTIELLKQYGVELRDLEGKFVGPYEAVRRLSEGLSRIDPRSADFARISEELGGFRQIGKVIPLIQQFAVAQDALNVAQKGSGSLSRDVQTAQQSLAVQFAKTRENFLALVREIGDSQSFKAVVNSTLFLTNALVDLGRALKPLLPLLLTFGAIKVGGSLNQLFSGFGLAFALNRGGGGGPGGAIGGGGGGGGPGGGGGNQPLSSALGLNTTATNVLNQTITALNTSILALNQNIVNNNSLLMNRPARGFATGGLVPGSGNRDTVRANLTPGEFVIRKRAVEAIGVENLAAMNRGGEVQKFMAGSPGGVRVPSGKGRGKKVKRGSRSRYDLPQPGDKDFLAWVQRIYAEYDADPSLPRVMVNGIPTPPEIAFVERETSKIFEGYGAGIVVGRDAKGFEVISKFGKPEPSALEAKEAASRQAAIARRKTTSKRQQKLFRKNLEGVAKGSAAGLLTKEQTEILSPENLAAISKDTKDKVFSIPIMQKEVAPANTGAQTLLSTLQAPLSAFRKSGGQTSLAGLFPGGSASQIKSAIPRYIASLGSGEPQKVAKANTALKYFDSFIGGGMADKPGHATAFTETINQILKSGLVQEFADGGEVEIMKNMIGTDGIYRFGIAALRSGTKNQKSRTEHFKLNFNTKKQKSKRPPIDVEAHIGSVSGATKKNATNEIEKYIRKSIQSTIVDSAKSLKKLLGVKSVASEPGKQNVLKGTTLSSAVGSVFEGALGLLGAPYIDKTEKIKSMDFPFGMGPELSEKFFGSSSLGKIPTDATRTFGGAGKNLSDFKGQIRRFIVAVDNKEFTKALEKKEQTIAAKQLKSSPEGQYFKSIQQSWVGTGTGQKVENALASNAIYQQLKAQGLPRSFASRSGTFLSTMKSLAVKDTLPLEDRLALLKTVDNALKVDEVTRRATGGGISGEDTVPALLTPGEFVFNKDSAQRIGYGTLNKLNKVKGYNKGGIVSGSGAQTFAEGGMVNSVMVGAALSSVLLPQVQKLSDTFGKLEGTAGLFGSALSGAIRETSSAILSTSIALEAVGASGRMKGGLLATSGIGSAVGGALTDTTGKMLEKALLENTKAISTFDKALQDYANAPTEELKIEAAKNVEKRFLELDSTLRRTKPGIDSLERLKNTGDLIQNLTNIIITTAVAMTALKAATQNASLAVASSKLSILGQGAAGVAGAAGGLSLMTKFLAVIGKFTVPIAIATTVISAAVEVWGYLSTTLKSSDEQFAKLNESLRETIKVSNDYNLANSNFVNNILPQYRKLVEGGRPGDVDKINQRIGGLSTNDLNITRNFMLKQIAAQRGVNIDKSRQLTKQETAIVKEAENEANRRYIVEGFAAAMKERGMTDPTQIQRNFQELGGEGSPIVRDIATRYFGELDRRLLAERSLAQASKDLKINMVNLTNTVGNLESIFNRSLSNLQNDFKDVNNTIDILLGDIKIQSDTILERNIQVLENLKQSTPQEISKALQTISPIINPNPLDFNKQIIEQTEIFGKIVGAVQANAILQQRADIVLNKISQLGLQGDAAKQVLSDELKGLLIDALGGGVNAEDQASSIIGELTAAIQKGGEGGKPILSLQDAASAVEGFGVYLNELNNTTKTSIDLMKALNQAEQNTIESMNRQLEINKKVTETQIQIKQTQIRNNLELKRILDQRISLEEANSEFLSQLQILTQDTGIKISGQLTADKVREIADELEKAKQSITEQEKTPPILRSLLFASTPLLDLTKKADNLQQVLDLVADSGILVKNAFTEISKDRDLFKSQDQLLFDLLKDAGDPKKALELERVTAAVKAVELGVATRRQAELAGERGVSLVKATRGEEASVRFFDKVMGILVARTPTMTQEQAQAKAETVGFRATRGLANLQALEDAMAAENAAQNDRFIAQGKALLAAQSATTSIFQTFTKDIGIRFQSLIDTILSIENNAISTQQMIKPVDAFPNEIRNNILSTVNALSQDTMKTVFDSAGNAVDRFVVKKVVSEQTASETLQVIGTGTPEQIADALDKFRIEAVERGSGAWFGPTRQMREQRVNEELTPILNQARDYLKTLTTPQQGPKVPPRNQGAALDTRNTDRFITSANQLATALSADSPSITKLTEAVGGLKPSTDNLVNAVAELKALFKDGKIQVSQETKGEVSVNFNNSLPIERDANADSRFLDQVSQIAQDTISQKLNSFLRQLS